MKDNGLLTGMFGSRSSEKEKPRSRLNKLSGVVMLLSIAFYPFVIVGALFGAPFYYYHFAIDKKKHGARNLYVPKLYQWEKIFWLFSVLCVLINAFLFVQVMPRAYFSAYEYFPIKQIGSPLVMSFSTIPALFMGGLLFGSLLLNFFLFQSKQRVESADERRKRVQKSQAYLERRQNRFETGATLNEKYEAAIQEASQKQEDKAVAEAILGQVLIGRDEYGEDTWLPLKELNQHAVIFGTTGVGKTTLLEVFFDYCARLKLPGLIIDGKGSPETRQSVEEYAKKHGRTLKIFSDEHNLRYNPIKYGNSIVVRDKLISLAESESVYYSTGAKKLLQLTVQLMDHVPSLSRDFPTLSSLLNGKPVLEVFKKEIPWNDLNYEAIYQKKKGMIDAYQKQQEGTKKEQEAAQEKQAELAPGRGRGRAQAARQNHLQDSPEQAEVIQEMLFQLPLYQRIKFLKFMLPEPLQTLFYDLFESYETSENGIFQLYMQAENLRANVDLLLKSEIGYLFDTKEAGIEELDLLESDANNELIYVALDGLIYKAFIEALAHFFIGEINFLASYRYRMQDRKRQETGQEEPHKPMFLFCDEPTTYLSMNFMDTVNKTRGAGIHTIFSPQTITDLKLKDEKLAKILIGNANTYFVGRLNDPEEAEYISKLIGTFTDIEVTEVTEQESGYSSFNRSSWTGEKGTKRNVSVFKIHPDTIKELKKGEFVLYRKASQAYTEPSKVYVRKP